MGIENLSLRLKNTQSFTLDEMIFLICGIDPITLTQAEDRHVFLGVVDPGMPFNTQTHYWVTDREKSDFNYVHNLIRQDKLGWIVNGKYNHDNPEIHNQESILNPENISSVASLHQAFMNTFNRASEAAKELLKIQIEGFKQKSDYKSTLNSLQTEILIPHLMVDDLDWLTRICKKIDRDLTGKEVREIKSAYDYQLNGGWLHRDKSDKTFSKQNIAFYLKAKNIESVFDFGQCVLQSADILTKASIEDELKKHDYVKTETAKALGVTKYDLEKKILQFGIQVPVSKFQTGNAKSKKVGRATPFSGLVRS